MWLEFCYIKLQRRQYHQFSSVALLCLTLCDPTGCSLLKLMSIESVTPSKHLILCHPLLLPLSIFPSIRVFPNESVFCIRWPNYWSLSISPSTEYSGLIFFRMDWLNLLSVQGTLSRVVSNTTVQKHQFFGTQLSSQSNSHIHT